MRKNKGLLSFILAFLFIFNLLPITSTMAVDNVDIISSTKITAEQAKKWAKSKGATDTFIGLADLYWEYASSHGGVNPALAYVQSAKETGYGKFTGVLDESYNNPCGMKNSNSGTSDDDYDKDAHHRFKSWNEGVQAHLDHLALYAGAEGYPRSNTTDPRHFGYLAGKAKTALSLTGNWAGGTYGSDLVKLYNDLSQQNASDSGDSDNKNNNDSDNTNGSGSDNTKPQLEIKGFLEEPSGANVSGTSVKVSGWVLATSGLKEVQIYVDGKLMKTVTNFFDRKDVKNVYSEYANCGNPGFSTSIDVTGLSSGNKEVIVKAITNDGKTKELTSPFKITRLGMKGNLEEPGGATYRGSTAKVSGWILATSGLKEVQIYVDGKLNKTVTDFFDRRDVKNAFPSYANCGNPGFSTSIDITGLSSGSKKVVVKAIANDGTTDEYTSSLVIEKLGMKGNLEEPGGATYRGSTAKVSGWILATSGLKEVQIYVDGKLNKTVTNFFDRKDVKNAFPSYADCGNPGFSTSIDVTGLSSGSKKVVVKAIANDGTTDEYTSSLVIEKLGMKGNLEEPGGATYRGSTAKVSGWILATSGLKEVQVYVDGKLMKTVTDFFDRKDVKNAFPSYADCGNPGFSTSIDVTGLSSGSKKVVVKAIANDGTTDEYTSSLVIEKLEMKGNLEEPGGATYKGSTAKVSGWVLSPSGLKEVQVFVDGKLMKIVKDFFDRKDVKNAFPAYSDCSNPGFSTSIDVSGLSTGTKTVVVKAIANDGTVKELSSSFVKEKLPMIATLEEPAGRTYTGSTAKVSGWILEQSGVKEVQIYVDGSLKKTVTDFFARPDVVNVYTNYSVDDSVGFSTSIGLSDIRPGNREVVAKIVAKDGTTKQVESTLVNSSSETKIKDTVGAIDSPESLSLQTSEELSVSGWILDDLGVKSVNIYVDDILRKTVVSKNERPDVGAVYPGYYDGIKCGFSTKININSLSVGKHKVTVESVANDGAKYTLSKEFYYKEKPAKTIVVDPGHNPGNIDRGARVNGYDETELNMEIASKLRKELKDKGYNVILTRDFGVSMSFSTVTESLDYKVNVANLINADLFISIHQNSNDNPSAHGTEVYYSTNDSQYGYISSKESKVAKSSQLASKVVNNISSNTGFYNRGPKDANFYVVRHSKMPSILVECGFISNPTEGAKLSDSSVQTSIAKAITSGVSSAQI